MAKYIDAEYVINGIRRRAEQVSLNETAKFAIDSTIKLLEEIPAADVEELRKGFTADMDCFASEYDSKIKSEAIKEFAERLKEINNNRAWFCGIFNKDIDNLVKEMTEKTDIENNLNGGEVWW